MSKSVEIVEVGPRDGLQNEPEIVSVENKRALIERAIAAGVRRLEAASFVNPKRVPQMAGAEELIASLPQKDGVTYIGLVLNRRGAERALETAVHELGAVALTTDTFAGKNQGQTAAESADVACEIVRVAKDAGRKASVTISAAFGCPFEGEVSPERVVAIAEQVAEAEPHEIALADTIGVGDPWRVADVVHRVKEALPKTPLRAHFHNTRNTGLANAYAAVGAGVATLDASLGGIGGCPFAPAATGNIPTEDLVYMLERGGIETGLDLDKLISASKWLSVMMNKSTPAMVSKAGSFPKSEDEQNSAA
jgi:hydroxymethylglutaryl-CoA lyase